jgi:hypothetical protein
VGDNCLLDPLERGKSSDRLALHNGTNSVDISHPPYLRMEADPVSETLCSLEYWTMEEDQVTSIPVSTLYNLLLKLLIVIFSTFVLRLGSKIFFLFT